MSVCERCGQPTKRATRRFCSNRCARLAEDYAARARPLEERYWEMVDKRGPDECWPWTGATARGYGFLNSGDRVRRNVPAHVVGFTLANGNAPRGVVDHECHNAVAEQCAASGVCLHKLCQNPRHLADKSQRENLLASPLTITSINAAKTHCPVGHPLDGTTRDGSRYCKACKRASQAIRDAVRRAKQPSTRDVACDDGGTAA